MISYKLHYIMQQQSKLIKKKEKRIILKKENVWNFSLNLEYLLSKHDFIISKVDIIYNGEKESKKWEIKENYL